MVILGDGTNVQRKTFSHKGIHYPKFNLDSSRPTKKSNVYRLSKYMYIHSFPHVIASGNSSRPKEVTKWQTGGLITFHVYSLQF